MILKYAHIIIFIFLIACNSTPNNKNELIQDRTLKREMTSDTITKEYDKKGEHFVEKFVNDSLIQQKIFLNDTLRFLWPITRSALPKSKIYLSSGRTYLTRSETDTIQIINPALPTMHRGVHVIGGMITWYSDTSYIISVNPAHLSQEPLRFYVDVLVDSSDADNNNFISDSLIIPIK